MQVIKPPMMRPPIDHRPRIFLAGSIEQGKAVDWQAEITKLFEGLDCIIYNPRREVWDASLEQDITNPIFKEQVNWELDALAEATWIIMYFDPTTMSPITLLEFGKYYESERIFVACPDGFWRKGNIQVCCERADIRLLQSLGELKDEIQILLNDYIIG